MAKNTAGNLPKSGQNDAFIAGLILLFLLAGFRQFQFRSFTRRLETVPVHVTVTVWQKPSQNRSEYTIGFRGYRLVCSRSNPSCKPIKDILPGNQLSFSVTPDQVVTNNELGQKKIDITGNSRVIISTKTPFISPGWHLLYLNKLKDRIETNFKRFLPEPHAGLLAGIVLGSRADMPPDFYQDLVKTGTLHVIAASGYNISVVTNFVIASLVIFIPRKKAAPVAGGGILIYMVLAGLSPAVVRAGLMGLLLVLAQASGRGYLAVWGLFWIAGLMLVISPWLITDISFQLSLAATAGLMGLSETIASLLPRIKLPGNLKTDLVSTLSATITTTPLTLLHFGRITLISPLANFMLLWLVPPIMALGALAAGLALIVPPLGHLAHLLGWPLLNLFTTLVTWWAKVPWAELHRTGAGWLFAAGWWFCLAGILSWFRRRALVRLETQSKTEPL